MLQHEFGVQIKGRTDCTIEEYCKLEPIRNALPAKSQREKEFVFAIFNQYQQMLQKSSVYDLDDIIIQALSQLNAPFWRRERGTNGFDYIFIDEIHLFNINEQHVFHYLTKDLTQEKIPVCFALDYGQAIGDRGDIKQDYVEYSFKNADRNEYKTVFRSSQEITDFCACVSASGALMFQADYRNSYATATSGFTHMEESICRKPILYMYADDNKMIESLKYHVDTIRRETQCNNKEIAIISFEERLLQQDMINKIQNVIGNPVRVLNKRFSLKKTLNLVQRTILFYQIHIILMALNLRE